MQHEGASEHHGESPAEGIELEQETVAISSPLAELSKPGSGVITKAGDRVLILIEMTETLQKTLESSTTMSDLHATTHLNGAVYSLRNALGHLIRA